MKSDQSKPDSMGNGGPEFRSLIPPLLDELRDL